ncbi:MAG: GFA family protein [Pseudomonadota bacterium]
MTVTGRCLCGAIRYTISRPLTHANICHCSQCRRQSGHVIASADAPRAALAIEGEEELNWFSASPRIKRGFCRICGSHLFWDQVGLDVISVNLGPLDAPTGIQVDSHIFVADKGDYYEIDDGLLKHDRYPEEQ